MELVSIIQSTAIRFSSPKNEGGIFLPDLFEALRLSFKFVEYPRSVTDYNLTDGVTLNYGVHNGVVIKTFKLYSNGMFISGMNTTDQLDEILDVVQGLFQTRFGTTLVPSEPVHKLYSSQLEVRAPSYSPEPTDELRAISDKLTATMRGYGLDVAGGYGLSGFTMAADPLAPSLGGVKAARFLFERRADRPYSENIFFAEAPLQTKEHLEVLGDLEAILTNA
jgi:hypothetical protein